MVTPLNIVGVSAIVTVILCSVILRARSTNVTTLMTDTISSYINGHDQSMIKVYNNNCDCIKYDCGCCQHIAWYAISLNGKLCVNASYLENEYGISVTVTYNDYTIINMTVSVRNPPPICFGEDIVDAIQVEVCLRIYDIDIESDKFHACFEIFGKIMHIDTDSIKLGCVTTKLKKQLDYIENDGAFHLLQLLRKRKTEDLKIPNVIMV